MGGTHSYWFRPSFRLPCPRSCLTAAHPPSGVPCHPGGRRAAGGGQGAAAGGGGHDRARCVPAATGALRTLRVLHVGLPRAVWMAWAAQHGVGAVSCEGGGRCQQWKNQLTSCTCLPACHRRRGTVSHSTRRPARCGQTIGVAQRAAGISRDLRWVQGEGGHGRGTTEAPQVQRGGARMCARSHVAAQWGSDPPGPGPGLFPRPSPPPSSLACPTVQGAGCEAGHSLCDMSRSGSNSPPPLMRTTVQGAG